jgi:hypothetical protein
MEIVAAGAEAREKRETEMDGSGVMTVNTYSIIARVG